MGHSPRAYQQRVFQTAGPIRAADAGNVGGRHSRVSEVLDRSGRGRFAAVHQWEVVRIIREAVHDTVKHADAAKLGIRLQATDGQVRLCVEDDGRGFDPRKPREGFGLTGMRERTGDAVDSGGCTL